MEGERFERTGNNAANDITNWEHWRGYIAIDHLMKTPPYVLLLREPSATTTPLFRSTGSLISLHGFPDPVVRGADPNNCILGK